MYVVRDVDAGEGPAKSVHLLFEVQSCLTPFQTNFELGREDTEVPKLSDRRKGKIVKVNSTIPDKSQLPS